MTSILYPDGFSGASVPLEDRRFAIDLNLDQVFAAVTAGREQLDLLSLFYSPLNDLDGVAYRHEVLRDFERPAVLAAVRAFGRAMSDVRELLVTVSSLHNRWQQARVFVDAVSAYCEGVTSLALALTEARPDARALRAFTAHICDYQSSERFRGLVEEAGEVVSALGTVRYTLHIRGNRVTVSSYQGEPDYAQEVEKVFAKFREGPTKDYRATFRGPLAMNWVEGQVVDLVAQHNPGPFGALERYFRDHQVFLDAGVKAFDRDCQFYLAYLEFIDPLRATGLRFCYPRLSLLPGAVRATAVFDLALAARATSPGRAGAGMVTNDFNLGPGERIMVVTGPNNGGKTTFARAVGQVHYLAALGLPVPAEEADLVLVDGVFTSFVQAEKLGTMRSHLEDELVSLYDVVHHASARSVVVMNESFSSTTLRDATLVGKAVLAQLAARGPLCLFVTFIDELATEGENTVSLVATVDPDDPVVRTYKVLRKAPEGRAYAEALAEHYGLTMRAVEERVGR